MHTLTWAPAPNLNPRTFLVRAHARSTAPATASSTGPPNAFVGRAPARRRRARAGHRRGLRPAELRAGPGGAHPHRHRRTVALDAHLPARGRSRSSPTPTTSWPASTSTRPPTPIDWSAARNAPGTISFRIPNVPSGLYYAAVRRGGRPGRLRAVRRPPGQLGATGRVLVDPADEHVAGLQLPGRRRQRLRRHVVRRAAEPHRRPRAHVHRARRPAALLPLRPAVPALAATGPARARSSSPIPTSTRSRTATTSRAPTTWSSSRGTRST